MSTKTLLASVAAFVLAALLAFGTALAIADFVERRTAGTLREALAQAGLGWVEIAPDGLTVQLSGTAPDESARIRALQVAGSVVDASRIGESIAVTQRSGIVAPVFRIEVMRNRGEVSVIGLVPAGETGGGAFPARLAAALPGVEIEDMLQSSAYPVPGGWVAAVDFAVDALSRFEVGRVSVTAGRIEVEALVDSPEARRRLEEALRAAAPRGQVLTLELTAPRPVAAPFLLRVEAEDGALRLGSCVADTEEAQNRIGAALTAAGVTRRLNCPLALGAPTPRWGEGAAAGIAALAQLGAGSLTLSDASVSLVVPHTVETPIYDRAVGRLETALPEAFSLEARHLPAPEADAATRAAPEVTLTLSPDGLVTIGGRLPDARIRDAVRAFAASRFGASAVEMATRLDDALPSGWAIRVLTALEALAELHHGDVRVTEDAIDIEGVSGNPDAASQVQQVLTQQLGAEARFDTEVRYDEALDPLANAPTPDVCEARVQGILADTKITFDPGSAEINAQASAVIDRIAEALQDCGELPFEVAGYTDSQGRDETNLNLSQARAEAVINALLARRVLVASLVARGYGEENPIAGNDTEEGREANRRIEFHLIRPEPEPEPIDPALEAELRFEIQTPGDDTVRPRPRPGSQPAGVIVPTVGSGDEDMPPEDAPAEDGAGD